MQKRVKKQAEDFAIHPLPNMHIISPFYLEDNYGKQLWMLIGPHQSPYEQKQYQVQVMYPSDYPFRPPHIAFITQIFHPSIYKEGNVSCCSFPQYKNNWSPAINISILLSKILEMMQFPKKYMSKNCGNREAITLITNDEPSFYLRARQQANMHEIDALLDD